MYHNNQKGITLVEVVAAILIISLVTLSFSQFFIQSNKVSAYNNEKLVVINLANAELERLKFTPSNQLFGNGASQITKPSETYINYHTKTIEKTTFINEVSYLVKIIASQTREEHAAKLIHITIDVYGPNNKSKSTVEGYIQYE